MHAFHEYLRKQLHDLLTKRRVVAFYDPREEFTAFIDELPAVEDGNEPVPQVHIGALPVHLARFEGSFFGVRALVEPLVAVDEPAPLLLYLPGVQRDRAGSVLMELEKGGACYEPQLKRLARNVLRHQFTDGRIDEMLAPEAVTYKDVVQFVEQGGGEVSMLKVIYGALSSIPLLAQWLADDAKDTAIEAKEAGAELFKLIETRLGLALDAEMGLAQARIATLRYILVGEFRADLLCPPPLSISMIPEPPTPDHLGRVRELVQRLREHHADAYRTHADQVESLMGLANDPLKAPDLGSVDTFRFEELLLLAYSGELIEAQRYAEALDLVDVHSQSFWAKRVSRRAQWEACRLMAELGGHVQRIDPLLGKAGTTPAPWIEAYASDEAGGWYRLDQTHRRLEAWVAQMDDDSEAETALDLVRRAYERLLQKMATGFAGVLQQADWTVPGVLHQTQICPDVVATHGGRTAYFVVDAMRYEMGVELAEQLQGAEDLAVRPAVAALPTITCVGMAALLPAASSSFSVVEHKGKLAAEIEGTTMPGIRERLTFLKANVPDMVEMRMEDLLQASTKKLNKTLADAPLILVRSQEIDALGESGSNWLARQVMDTVIGNVARAVRKLANAGIEHFVITADHGHQFSLKKGEDMKTDHPGGDTVERHRRCWAGHGGTTPPGTVRVSGARLGYNTDLDFIFPMGLGVFPSGGDLSYHHGSISLQELLVPVLTLRMPAPAEPATPGTRITLSGYPEKLTNRTVGIRVQVEGDLFVKEPIALHIILVSEGEQVGKVGMAIDAELDRATGYVHVTPGTEANVGLMLTRDDCKTVRIVVQDPASGKVLHQTHEIPVQLGI